MESLAMDDKWHKIADEYLAEFQKNTLNYLRFKVSRNRHNLIEFRRNHNFEKYSASKMLVYVINATEQLVEMGLITEADVMANKNAMVAGRIFNRLSERYDDDEGETKAKGYTSEQFLECFFEAYEEVFFTGDADPGYIYLVQAVHPQNHYKIGLSKNPVERIRKMGVILPFPIEVKHLMKTNHMKRAEKHLHEEFSHKRLNGEWFDLDDADVQSILCRDKVVILDAAWELPEGGAS
jgi:hypothetical protein